MLKNVRRDHLGRLAPLNRPSKSTSLIRRAEKWCDATCDECLKRFTARRKTAKYCSESCKCKAYRKRRKVSPSLTANEIKFVQMLEVRSPALAVYIKKQPDVVAKRRAIHMLSEAMKYGAAQGQ